MPARLGAALQAAEAATVGGQVRADALLGALAPLGDRAAALGHVLVDHLRYGVPLAPASSGSVSSSASTAGAVPRRRPAASRCGSWPR